MMRSRLDTLATLPGRWIACLLLAFLCLCAGRLQAQVIDESLPQDSTWVGVGADSADFVGQDFVADIRRVRKIGVWLKATSGDAQVRLALAPDNGNSAPDLSLIMHESPMLTPDTAGGWLWDSTFSEVLTVGEKYWILVDGYQNLVGSGYATVGTSLTYTNTGSCLRYSIDGGVNWILEPIQPMAIHVEGDNCTFPLNITPLQPLLCPGGTSTFGVPAGYVSYIWNTGQTSSTISVSALGIYTVHVVDTANCTASASTLVAQGLQPVTGLLNYYEVCPGTELQLTTPPFYTDWQWSTGATTNADTIHTSGNYWVSITSSSGCVTVDSFIVDFKPFATTDIGQGGDLCLGDTLHFAVDSIYLNYLWSTGHTGTSVTLTSTTTLWVEVIDSGGCKSISDTVQYNFYPNPAQPLIQSLPTGLHSSFANGYQWLYEGLPISGQTLQDLPDPTPGNYAVIVTNAFGCVDTSAIFTVAPPAPGDFVSGGISPNGDGLNETFFVEGISRYPDCHLQVFNRWGDRVCDRQPYLNDWDGTSLGGGALPAGEYYYILEFGAGRETMRGTVIISR